MDIIEHIDPMRAWSQARRQAGRRLALVPTMGFLHEGHATLMRLAAQHADDVVVSIFVNPLQFGPTEDFETYPRDAGHDRALCQTEGVSALFQPASIASIYPPGSSVIVHENQLSKTLCGASRPGHFDGVLTIVAKLFHIVQPDVALFGQKDAQQLRLIEQMAHDLNIPVGIIPAPIVREADGLALSSRNAYLSPGERREARCLRQALDQAETLFHAGERSSDVIRHAMRDIIETMPSARIDYIDIVSWQTFEPAALIEPPCLAALAVFIGRTRLIDNTWLGLATSNEHRE